MDAEQTTKNAVPSVGVIGGGLAGLTCALRLAQRGYRVTVYEATDTLGGNLSSARSNDTMPYYDVYPHMFCDWYANFWNLFENDLKRKREEHFARKHTVKLRRRNWVHGRYTELTSSSSPELIWKSLNSGFKPMMDMYLYGYAMIDIASRKFDQSLLINNDSIVGFLYSQYYTSEKSAQVFDLVLREIWSINGSRASVDSYQKFAQHTLNVSLDPEKAMPFAWLLKGSIQQRVMGPLEDALTALKDDAGNGLCTIQRNSRVLNLHVHRDTGRVKLGFAQSETDRGADAPPAAQDAGVEHDFVVLAVTPESLGNLVRSATPGERIVDHVHDLASSRRLRAEPIPVVHLHFKDKLPGIPPELTALAGPDKLFMGAHEVKPTHAEPKIDLTFLDISQLWENEPNLEGGTTVVLAASNFYGLLSENKEEAGFTMIAEFFEHLGLTTETRKLGHGWPKPEEWGGLTDGIDWSRTEVRMNTEHKLYVNEVGNSHWCPKTRYPELPNVFFAGDFTEQDYVGMATIEAAVISGLNAANAVRDASAVPLGEAIEVKAIPGLSRTTLAALRLLLAPSAFLAKGLSLAKDAAEHIAHDDYGMVPRAAAKIAQLPFVFVLEAANATYDLLATLEQPLSKWLANLTKKK